MLHPPARRALSVPVAALCLVSAAFAQATPLILVGDPVPGGGAVVDVLDLAINPAGDWIATVQTDDPNPATDEVVLRNGAVLIREGDPLGGATFESFASVSLNALGESGMTAEGAPRGVYFDTQPVAQEGQLTLAPGFSPGTDYWLFNDSEINDARQILANVLVRDDAIPGLADRVMMILQVDAAGALVSETVVVKESDVIPGLASPIEGFAGSQETFSINEAGDVIVFAQLDTQEGVILLNQTLVAKQGDQSPEFGSTYYFFDGRVDLGDGGDHAFIAYLDNGSTFYPALIWNGLKVIRVGESVPDFAPYTLQNFGSHPVFVDAAGAVYWFGDWSDPDIDVDSGIFRDHDLVLREGASLADGTVIDEIDTSIDVADDGSRLGFVATLADGRRGAFLLDLSKQVLSPYSGCTPNAGVLDMSGIPALSEQLTFGMKVPQASGVATFVGIASEPVAGYPPCGPPLAGAGELLIGSPVLVLDLGPATPFTTTGSLTVPVQTALVGQTLYAQGLFVDAFGLAPGEPLRLTDAWSVPIGP